MKLGNKKSVVAFGIGAYNAKVHVHAARVVKKEETLSEGAAGVLSEVEANPVTTLGPCAVGYWFWGKPVVGAM